ncbi:hypothetical protein KEM55_001781, partial [Ascosphaera atra]
IKPAHYNLSLYDLKFAGSWSYNGTVKVDCKVVEETDEIVLNTKEIEVHSAQITAGDATLKASDISYDKLNERATFKFPSKITPAGADAKLVIDFSAKINDHMAGFSRAKYTPAVTPHEATPTDGQSHYMFSTQFEACDARQAFPCFDEPNLKATFDFEIEIPKGLTALSNMPVKSTRAGSNDKLEVVSFERTPIMSTYLLAWALGDFEYVEAMTERKYKDGKPIPVRIYTTRGLKNQAEFAVSYAYRTVDYFSEIFDVDYPLPKMDMLAVHEFAMGAMENWGLVTYRTTAILFEEGKSDARYKNRVAYVIAHELAHQWFGNLVTMDWWNELWLNEGFATWVGWLAIDHFHPEWQIWSQFVAEATQAACELDSLRASHPIEVPVKNALEVDQIFDKISYLKGSSVIRMLASHLGRRTFLKGVSAYLKGHAYGNAKTTDLWDALSKVSGQDVTSQMDMWIRKIGFPLVTVKEDEKERGTIHLSQKRFLSSGDAKPEEDQTTWWIPLAIRSGIDAPGIMSVNYKAATMTEKEQTVTGLDEDFDPNDIENENDFFYKINASNSSFFRTNYPASRLEALGYKLPLFTTEDKIGLIGDAAALAVSGEGNTTALLAFTEKFQQEENTLVWKQLASSLGNLRSVFSEDDEISNALKKYVLKLVTPVVGKVGWEFKPDEDYLTGQLRQLLIPLAGHVGHEEVVREAKVRFDAWAAGDKTAIHPNLRSAIFSIVAHTSSEGHEQNKDAGKEEYDIIKKEYETTDSIDGKEICLMALGRTRNPALYSDLMEFLLSPAVAIQDIHTGAASLAGNSAARKPLWEFIKKNWDAIEAKLTSNKVILQRFVQLALARFADNDTEKDIIQFFENKDKSGYDRGLEVVLDTVRTNAKYRARDQEVVKKWLKEHGY